MKPLRGFFLVEVAQASVRHPSKNGVCSAVLPVDAGNLVDPVESASACIHVHGHQHRIPGSVFRLHQRDYCALFCVRIEHCYRVCQQRGEILENRNRDFMLVAACLVNHAWRDLDWKRPCSKRPQHCGGFSHCQRGMRRVPQCRNAFDCRREFLGVVWVWRKSLRVIVGVGDGKPDVVVPGSVLARVAGGGLDLVGGENGVFDSRLSGVGVINECAIKVLFFQSFKFLRAIHLADWLFRCIPDVEEKLTHIAIPFGLIDGSREESGGNIRTGTCLSKVKDVPILRATVIDNHRLPRLRVGDFGDFGGVDLHDRNEYAEDVSMSRSGLSDLARRGNGPGLDGGFLEILHRIDFFQVEALLVFRLFHDYRADKPLPANVYRRNNQRCRIPSAFPVVAAIEDAP